MEKRARHPVGSPVPAWLTLLLDVVAVLVFVAIGRSTHAHGVTASGMLETGWPFLLSLLIGHVLVATVWMRAPVGLLAGLLLALGTVGLGMLLRSMTGAGTDPAFILVATGVVTASLLGWRLVARLATRR